MLHLYMVALVQLIENATKWGLIFDHVPKKKSVSLVKSTPNCSKGWHKIGTLPFQTSLLNKCHERADKWADDH